MLKSHKKNNKNQDMACLSSAPDPHPKNALQISSSAQPEQNIQMKWYEMIRTPIYFFPIQKTFF